MPLPTTTKAYYNEHDKFAAAWLRELIRAGLIADGDVDERDIQDVQPKELDGYTQCHFFAGIGVWSYSLRRAGWPDDRPVWTGSCPCQPYSAAGKGKGHADERHLWPYFHYLVEQCKPPVVFGEQVEAAIKHGWLDLVQADLEGSGYAFGTACVPAAGVGAPHIRSRLYFVGERCDAAGRRQAEWTGQAVSGSSSCGEIERSGDALSGSDTQGQRSREGLAHTGRSDERGVAEQGAEFVGSGGSGNVECGSDTQHDGHDRQAERTQAIADSDQPKVGLFDGDHRGAGRDSAVGDDGHTERDECEQERPDDRGRGERSSTQELEQRSLHDGAGKCDHTLRSGLEGHRRSEQESVSEGRSGEGRHASAPGSVREYANRIGATRGFWADCDWWYGRDQKYRPIKPGVQPLAHGAPARVGRLRGYGNAIVAPLAEAFIAAYLEVVDERA